MDAAMSPAQPPKHHAKIGLVKTVKFWVRVYTSARLELGVQFALVLELCYCKCHGINWIGPVKIQVLI
jgi:hypothetical protein